MDTRRNRIAIATLFALAGLALVLTKPPFRSFQTQQAACLGITL